MAKLVLEYRVAGINIIENSSTTEKSIHFVIDPPLNPIVRGALARVELAVAKTYLKGKYTSYINIKRDISFQCILLYIDNIVSALESYADKALSLVM